MPWIIDWLDILLGDGTFIAAVEPTSLFGTGTPSYRVLALSTRGGCNKIIYVVHGDTSERHVTRERRDTCERYVTRERYDTCERFCQLYHALRGTSPVRDLCNILHTSERLAQR